MGKYAKRFSKDDFKKELLEHLASMPKQYFGSRKHLEEHAAKKAEYYARALSALDEATEKLKSVAASHPDPSARTDADHALKKIDEAINAYGDAALNQNNSWGEPYSVE